MKRLFKFLCLALVAAWVMPVGIAGAADTHWNWRDLGHWSLDLFWTNGVPTSTDDAYINLGGTAVVAFGHAETARNLFLGTNIGDSGGVILTDTAVGLSILNNAQIGVIGTGAFTQTGGTHSVSNDLNVGLFLGSHGTYELSGGELSARLERIGLYGTGAFTQTGGTHSVSDNLYLGIESGSSGTYELSGTGSLSVGGDEFIGNYGTGNFNQSGGTHTVLGNLQLGFLRDSHAYGYGTYNLSGGSLDVSGSILEGGIGGGVGTLNIDGGALNMVNSGTIDVEKLNIDGGTVNMGNNGAIDVYYLNIGNAAGTIGSHGLTSGQSITTTHTTIGYAGTGTFNQSGGTHTIGANLSLGKSFGSSGTYELSGGELSAQGVLGYIGDSGTGTFTQTGGTHTVHRLHLGLNSSGSGTYELSGGKLSTNELNIGNMGAGTFTQTDGTNTVYRDLFLGRNAGSSGTYELSGGELSASVYSYEYNEYIGYRGTGAFTQTGGTHTVSNDLYLGHLAGSSGTYELSGTGSLSVKELETIGYEGTGVFTQTGGTHTVSNDLYLGHESSGNGTYGLSGTGSLAVATDESIGHYGTGTFTQTGGTHTVSDKLYLGRFTGSSGTYELSGGELSARGARIGYLGTGAFTQSGGTHNILGFLYLGQATGSSGTYALSDGELSVGVENISHTGAFTQTGGTHTVSSDLFSSGTYELSGGKLSAEDEFIGSQSPGDFTQTGGTNTAISLYVGQWNYGTYELSGGELCAEVEFIGYYGLGAFTQTGGTNTVSNDLNVAFGHGKQATYTISSGSLSAGNIDVGGSLAGVHYGGEGTLAVQGDATVDVAGTVTVRNNSRVEMSGGTFATAGVVITEGGIFDLVGGELETFSITGDLTNTGGTLAPGASPGLLTITGDYTQLDDAFLEIELGGLDRGSQYDALWVSEQLSLAGTLEVVWWDDFNASLGDTFDILDWDSLVGEFASYIFPELDAGLFWDISNLYADGTIFVANNTAPVPEPATLLLFGTGLIGLAGVRRKFKK